MDPASALRLRLGQHARCGLVAPSGYSGDYQYSLSSLPSIARRCSREQLSQNSRRRPFSTELVQVSVTDSSPSC